MTRFTITLDLPGSLPVPLGKGTGKSTVVPLSSFSPDVLAKGLVNGFAQAIGDISRGYSDDAGKVPNSDDVWASARQKRVDQWKQGNWASIERGDSNLTLVKDQYFAENLTLRHMDKAKTEAQIKDMVKAHLPKDTKATFQNFMLAYATAAKPDGTEAEIADIAKQIEEALLERALEAKAKREQAAAKVDTTGIDLAALLKPKAK